MSVAEALAGVVAVVVVLLALTFLAVAGRRLLLQRGGGAVEVSLRLKPRARGGWVQGIGRFVQDDLQWYRVFSLSPRPRRTFSRLDLRVVEQRPPQGPETYALLAGAVVLSCTTSRGPVQLGMDPSAVTGFLAWLEARPPGATLPPA